MYFPQTICIRDDVTCIGMRTKKGFEVPLLIGILKRLYGFFIRFGFQQGLWDESIVIHSYNIHH